MTPRSTRTRREAYATKPSQGPIVRHADDLAAFARRGGAVTAGCRLLVVRCASCRAPFLYDELGDRLYVDCDDLGRVIEDAADLERAVPCPSCAHTDWWFEDVPADDDTVLEGPWSFCFWRPPVTRAARGRLRRVAAGMAVGTLIVLGATALVFNPDPLASPDKTRKRVHVTGQPAG